MIILIVLFLIIITLILLVSCNKYVEKFQDPKEDFLTLYKVYFDNSVNCVVGKLFSVDHDNIDVLLTEEQFKNNVVIKDILEECTYNVMKSLYSFYTSLLQVKRYITIEEFNKWFVENIPVKVLTPSNILLYTTYYKKYNIDKVWTSEKKEEYLKKTKDRCLQLLKDDSFSRADAVFVPFISNKKYDDWLNYISTGVVNKVIDGYMSPNEYLPEVLTVENIDTYIPNGMKKLFLHARLAVTSFTTSENKKCSPEKIIQTMNELDIPFELNIPVTLLVGKVLTKGKCA